MDEKSEAEWRAALTPERYRVCREGGTEQPFTGAYWDYHGEGVFRCACCGAPLFDAATKFDSGTGWPSFWQALEPARVRLIEDRSHGMVRTEVRCARCGAHLGHLFPDGPPPTGQRFCINSVALTLEEKGA